MPGGARVSDNAVERNRITSLARYHANADQAKKVQKIYRERRQEERPFVGWDGEGYNAYAVSSDGTIEIEHRYMLFGASTGDYITGIDLDTADCLELILQTGEENPTAFNVGFAFEYDVNMILKNLPWRTLAILREQGHCRWKGPNGKRYRIEHVPHKWFKVSLKDGPSVLISQPSISTELGLTASGLKSLLGSPHEAPSPIPILKRSRLIGVMKYHFYRLSWTRFARLLMAAVIGYQNGTGLERWLLICCAIVAS